MIAFHNKCFLVVVLFLAASFLFGQVRAESYTHISTGVIFPDEIAGMEKGVVTDFESKNAGLGVGIRYNFMIPVIKVTIYLYTLGQASIPDGIESEQVLQQFFQAIGDVKQGNYSSVEEKKRARVRLGDREYLVAIFSYTQQNIERISHLYLAGYKNHFLKIRYTYHQSAEDLGSTTMRIFLKIFGDHLSSFQNY